MIVPPSVFAKAEISLARFGPIFSGCSVRSRVRRQWRDRSRRHWPTFRRRLMSSEPNPPQTASSPNFDLTPDPRVLQMLGEIELQQWRCIAELVDNSVDGFLNAERAGARIQNPEVVISVPRTDMPTA